MFNRLPFAIFNRKSEIGMTRIFVTLATIHALALIVTFSFGMEFMWEREAGAVAPRADQPISGDFAWHMVSGLVTGVFTLLVHCLIFTYFLGTGRWVKEVARAYQLPDDPLPKATREFKRTAFPPALFAMLTVIATIASGAGAQTASESWWGLSHPILAVAALAINGWAYVIEYRTVAANGVVMDQVMAEVEARQQAAEAEGDKVKG
jgi:hypothetical protein